MEVRKLSNWALLTRFAVVGLSGVIVNMLAMIALNVIGPDAEGAVVAIAATPYHVRWYHVFSVAAFLAANLWNFQLNRTWAFKSTGPWGREYRAFLTVGAAGQLVGLGVLTLLMHPHSPVTLPPSVFDDSSVLLTRVYWAQLIMIAVITPVSFAVNKVWTFRSVRQ